VNPFNPEAGETPAPSDPVDVAIAEQSARVIWCAFPYFAWRYGERGARFGRSDAGYLLTLVDVPEDFALSQIDWLAKLLGSHRAGSAPASLACDCLRRTSVGVAWR